MKHPGRTRRRALSCLLALALAPVVVAGVPVATAKELGPRAQGMQIAPAEPLLDGPARGRRAIRELGDQLPAAAARNDLRPGELRALLRTDDTVWVDPQGAIYYVDPVHHDETHEGHETEETHGAHEAHDEPAEVARVAPLSDTFALHSNPGASRTILLDFDGAHVSGSWWNAVGLDVLPATHPAWDPAGDGPAFNADERLKIQQIWAMVAEDYAPFDVDVTTEDPGAAGIVRSSSSDTVYGTRVLITPSDDPFLKICQRSCGGVAYLNVFDRIGSLHQPAWVFPQALQNDPKSIAEAASHEAGHNLGLGHDGGTASPDYYVGHGIWAPIMGVGYDRPLVQWSAGSYPGATNQQDDLAILAGYLGARPDEASDSVATPSPLPEDTAYIGTRHDVDAYQLGSCPAGSVVTVSPAALSPNLDVRAVLHDATGTQRAVAAPASGRVNRTTASGLGATLTVPTTGAQWVVTVEGAGNATWSTNGYDDYASLGAYTISAPGCSDEAVATGVPNPPRNVTAGAAQTDALTLGWSAPSEGGGPVTSYVVTRSGSTESVNLPGEARSHTFTGLAAGTTYQLSVRAVNGTGSSPAITVSATTAAPPPTPPSAPRHLTGSYDATANTLSARWSEPSSTGTQPIVGYAIFVDGQYLGQVGATHRGVEIHQTGTFAAGDHVVGVAAVSAVGSSPVATVTITVVPPATVPATPARPAAVRGDRSVQVSWAAPTTNGSAVTGYTVTSSPGGASATLPADATSTTVGGLANGTAYTFTVVATNAVGDSAPSAPSPGVTPAAAPTTMKPPTVVVRGRKAVVRWTTANPNGSPITRYLVDISRGQDRRLGAEARKTVYTLPPGRYRVRIAARNGVGRSPYGSWVRFRVR